MTCVHEENPDSLTGYCNCPLLIEMSEHWWDEFSFGKNSNMDGPSFDKWYVSKFGYEKGVLHKIDVPLYKRQIKI